MIKGLWGKIELECGNHPEGMTVKMQPKDGVGHQSMFYACPKYYPDNRTEGEKPCFNSLTIDDYEKIIAKISEEIEPYLFMGDKCGIENLTFKIKEIKVTIVSYSDDKIRVKIVNTKAISQK